MQSKPATVNELGAQPATVQGESAVLRAEPAVMRATIHITRKATGLVETFELVGTAVPYGVQLPPKDQTP